MMSDDDIDHKHITLSVAPEVEDVDDPDDEDDDENQMGHRLVSESNLIDDSNDGAEEDHQQHDDDVDDGDDDEHIISGSVNSPHESGHTIAHAQNVKIIKVVPLPHARSEVWTYFGFIADDDGEIQDKKKAICKICAQTLAYSGNTTNLFTHLKAMHPEAQPQKLAPTNRTPRTGKKSGKRKADVLETASGPLIVRAITYSNQHHDNNSFFDDDAALTVTSSGSVKPATVMIKGHVNTPNNSYSSSSGTIPIDSHVGSLVATEDITNLLVNWLVKDCRPICIVEGKGFQELVRLLAPGYVIPDSRRLQSLVKKKYDEVRRDLILRAMQDE